MSTVTTPEPQSGHANGFSPEAFASALERNPGLPWLENIRKNAWQQYSSLPYPDRSTEAFRFASLKRLDDSAFRYLSMPTDTTLAERTQLISETAGTLVLVNDQVASFTADESLLSKGVLFCPLAEAWKKHADIIQKYFQHNFQTLGSDKFYALHTAMCSNGMFLYVPRGVRIEKPFITYHYTAGDDAAIFPHSLVIAEESAEVTYIDSFTNTFPNQRAFVSSAGVMHAGDNASVTRKYIQNLSEASTLFHSENTIAGRDANATSIGVHLGGAYARFENALRITGENANARLYGLTVSANKQEFDQRTLQTHSAPHAFSDLLFKNALLEHSRTIFSGLIRVDEDAQQTDAYQTNRNLQLSDDAHAHSMPGLEILANDVKCSHGATTGRLDESELFYMRSRGIKPVEAKRLLVFGFFEEILQKIKSEELAESLRTLLHDKFDAISARGK